MPYQFGVKINARIQKISKMLTAVHECANKMIYKYIDFTSQAGYIVIKSITDKIVEWRTMYFDTQTSLLMKVIYLVLRKGCEEYSFYTNGVILVLVLLIS